MFCRIYISGVNVDGKSLLISVCTLLKGDLIDNTYVEKKGYSVEVRPNEEYDEKKEKIFPDGFLYFPYSVEIDIHDDVDKVCAAEEMSEILRFLWRNGYTAIASCDFEDLLPENGGYKSKNIPWVE